MAAYWERSRGAFPGVYRKTSDDFRRVEEARQCSDEPTASGVPLHWQRNTCHLGVRRSATLLTCVKNAILRT